MHNEDYPDLILEGLMYDFIIAGEVFKDSIKNTFRKIMEFLKRINNWFSDIFIEITKIIPKRKIDEIDLSKTIVTNYNVEIISDFISNCSGWFKQMRQFLNISKDVDYNNEQSIENYVNKLNEFFIDEKNTPLLTSSYRSNLHLTLDIESTPCTKEIINFIITSYKKIKNNGIKNIIQSCYNSFKALYNQHYQEYSPRAIVKLNAYDKGIGMMCINIMNVSYDILSAFYNDLVNINNII